MFSLSASRGRPSTSLQTKVDMVAECKQFVFKALGRICESFSKLYYGDTL